MACVLMVYLAPPTLPLLRKKLLGSLGACSGGGLIGDRISAFATVDDINPASVNICIYAYMLYICIYIYIYMYICIYAYMHIENF